MEGENWLPQLFSDLHIHVPHTCADRKADTCAHMHTHIKYTNIILKVMSLYACHATDKIKCKLIPMGNLTSSEEWTGWGLGKVGGVRGREGVGTEFDM